MVARKKPRTAAQKAATKKMIAARKKAISRPSQVTGKAPSARLKHRRAKPSVPGYFPNPHGIILSDKMIKSASKEVFNALKAAGKANTVLIENALESWAMREGIY